MPKKKRQTESPAILNFDFKLVQPRLKGLLTNVDRDLQRKLRSAEESNDRNAARCFGLLNILVRFAENSWKAATYLAADIPVDPTRDVKYALVLPTINRQLLDLLYSLIFMADSFDDRSLQYQRAGWREAVEEYRRYSARYSGDPDWRQHFTNLETILEAMVLRYGITDAQRKNPALIPYWKTPTQMKDEKTPSRQFLKYLDKWLYGDTSAQAHLSFGGLIVIAQFLVADLIGGSPRRTRQRTNSSDLSLSASVSEFVHYTSNCDGSGCPLRAWKQGGTCISLEDVRRAFC